jgi:lantibiotic biosynthesis protein
MIKIFPHSLLRITGESFDQLLSIEFSNTWSIYIKYYEKKFEIENLKTIFCEYLYQKISNLDSKTTLHKQLLNLKRDVYNNRDLSRYKNQFFFTALDPKDKATFKTFIEKKEQLIELELLFQSTFQSEEKIKAKEFKKILKQDTMRKGLLLSSQILLEQGEKFLKDPNMSVKKKRQFETGIIKYWSRLCTKTSPFSTFTNLGISKFNAGNTLIEVENNDATITSHIRLNNLLFDYLISILYSYRPFYMNVHLRLNPTSQRIKGKIKFLTNSKNIEAFQIIKSNAVLDVIFRLCKNKKNGLVFTILLEKILEKIELDGGEHSLEKYLLQLIDYGLLEYHIEVSGLDPDWDNKITNILEEERYNDDLLKELVSTLKEVKNIAKRYEFSDYRKRKTLLNSAYMMFKQISLKLHEAANLPEGERLETEERIKFYKNKVKNEGLKDKQEQEVFKIKRQTIFYFRKEQFFYEDSYNNLNLAINGHELNKFINTFDEYLSFFQKYDFKKDEKRKIIHYYDLLFQSKSENLLGFYESYYREIKKIEDENKPTELATSSKRYNKKFRKEFLVKNIKLNGHLVDFNISDFIEKEKKIYKTEYSQAAFIQFYQDNGILMGVVNSNFFGYGKLFSRFLHILPKEVLDDIRVWNREIQKKMIYVENSDSSIFNANIHPPLLDFEIWMPGSQNSLTVDSQISVTDLVLEKTGKHNIKIKQKSSGKVINVLDLGFQGITGRSNLFKLLNALNTNRFLRPKILCEFVNEELDKNEDLFVRPRLTFNKQIIIQRKAWIVLKKIVPQKNANDSTGTYFLKLNNWRIELGIPDNVFIYIYDKKNEAKERTKKTNVKRNHDDYKPQYISFKNAYLTNLFAKIIDKIEYGILIEEMLPAPEHLIKVNDKRFVTEHLVQWNTNRVNLK